MPTSVAIKVYSCVFIIFVSSYKAKFQFEVKMTMQNKCQYCNKTFQMKDEFNEHMMQEYFNNKMQEQKTLQYFLFNFEQD